MNLTKRDKRIELACRVLLTLEVLVVIRGYLVSIQTKYQLMSPLIPQRIPDDIAYPYQVTSLVTGLVLIATLWLYFLGKKILLIYIAAICLLLYEPCLILFSR